MDTKGVAGVAILLLAGLFLVTVSVLPVLEHNIAVQEYEPMEATILETEIVADPDEDDEEFRPAIQYSYTVDGTTYRSANVYPGRFTRWHGSRSPAADVVDDYEEGSDLTAAGDPVTIYYHPDDPSRSYLRNDGRPAQHWFGAIYALVAFVAGLSYLLSGGIRWKHRQAIATTPTEQVRSVSIGPSELEGRAAFDGLDAKTAPFTDEDCAVASYEVEEYVGDEDDGGGWETIDDGSFVSPFYLDDGTGAILVQPDEDTITDLDPDGWSSTYVESGSPGPPPIEEFVRESDGLSVPSDADGHHNDRRYRQNVIAEGDDVYVFGTVQPKDEVPDTGARNPDRLVVARTPEDSSLGEPLFLVSNDDATSLVDRRKGALWRLPVGGFFVVVSLAFLLLQYGPSIGLEVTVLF